jgi:hypothetical protein
MSLIVPTPNWHPVVGVLEIKSVVERFINIKPVHHDIFRFLQGQATDAFLVSAARRFSEKSKAGATRRRRVMEP